MKRYVAYLDIEGEIVGSIDAAVTYTYKSNGTNYLASETVTLEESKEAESKEAIKSIIVKSLEYTKDNCEIADAYRDIVRCGDCPFWGDCRNEHECGIYILDKLEEFEAESEGESICSL